MQKKVKSTRDKKRVRVSDKGLKPFTERPSDRDGREVTELFSYFTANIIKEEKLFTR